MLIKTNQLVEMFWKSSQSQSMASSPKYEYFSEN